MKKGWFREGFEDAFDGIFLLFALLCLKGAQTFRCLTDKLKRELIIIIWGYGGDIGEALVAGLRGFFDPDYAREVLGR